VGQRRPQDKDERVLLFLKMRPNHKFDSPLRDGIVTAIRQNLSARHVPAFIFEVQDIPYTSNGKRIENLVRNVVCGDKISSGGMAVNPECLKLFEQYADLPAENIVANVAKL
jgi:acetoacetyl-CoA synthetase